MGCEHGCGQGLWWRRGHGPRRCGRAPSIRKYSICGKCVRQTTRQHGCVLKKGRRQLARHSPGVRFQPRGRGRPALLHGSSQPKRARLSPGRLSRSKELRPFDQRRGTLVQGARRPRPSSSETGKPQQRQCCRVGRWHRRHHRHRCRRAWARSPCGGQSSTLGAAHSKPQRRLCRQIDWPRRRWRTPRSVWQETGVRRRRLSGMALG
jgi:hypothetical protein